ncbi:N-acetylmuramoyl-L-alanine amidase [Chitinivorax sp. B]|uniref:N-acetylmuramoyl-L-alanine amidase n=1 Tax=Chitinivorax sp. B TaxID=2502235 RepID=UPI0010F4E159|nr:N-acetylmuramoyl-L-alanine amidase [Chitinivorax sp. B]
MGSTPSKPMSRSRRSFLQRSSLISFSVLALPGCVVSAGYNSANARHDGGYQLDDRMDSASQDSRVRTLVLHYTARPLDTSLEMLTQGQYQVSAHYLVPDQAINGDPFTIYQLVPETRRAWHAGVSYWQGDRMINASSIGIEIVNLGFPPEDESLPLMQRRWYNYPPAQMHAVARLMADIIARHDIKPHKIVGHADVAPGRKFDPGPLFPWHILFTQYQIGAWPDAEAVQHYQTHQSFSGDIRTLQAKLLAYGYDTPQSGLLDEATRHVIAAFQMHFRPAKYDGEPDVGTVAILDALLEKYVGRPRSQPMDRQPATHFPSTIDHQEKGSDIWPSPHGGR